MNNLLTLIKVDLRETLDIRKFKENKGKSMSFFSFLGIIIFGALLISTIYNLFFSNILKGEDLIYSTIMMSVLATILTFSTSAFKVKSIFVGKDHDMLSSMPIKKTTIIAAKIINLYLIELLYSAVLLVPNLVINFIFTLDVTYVLTGLIVTILIPAFPIILSCIFSLFITLVADRYKFGNIINFILYAIMFAAIMLTSFLMRMPQGETEAAGLIKTADICLWINPTLYFIKLSSTSTYLFIFVFVAINILFCILGVSFISLFFDKIYTVINSYKSNMVYVRKKLETKGQFKTLLSNEYKRFFLSKYYFINCISSGICAIMMAGITAYMFSRFSPIEDAASQLPIFQKYAYLGVILIFFGIGIATPAAVSISIEGGNFWMIKSFPIDYKKLIKAKLLLSITVLGACSIVASTVIVLLVLPSIYSIFMIYILPILYVILASTLGVLINLTYYKLKWKNEQECVKNSAGVVISMLLDFVVTFLLAGILIGLTFVNIYLAGIGSAVILAIIIIIFYEMILKSVDKKIEKIEEF